MNLVESFELKRTEGSPGDSKAARERRRCAPPGRQHRNKLRHGRVTLGGSFWGWNGAVRHFRRRTSHSFTVLSVLAEAKVLPSGLQATENTSFVWPFRVANSLPAATSHSLIVWSQLPDARVLPSGPHATHNT